ncbi:MAG: hypothetical protein ACRD3F_10625, partial [Acidobacteriaceae bacterium]
MLDLAFVRSNLELVEKKLRGRVEDPKALIRRFQELHDVRRESVKMKENWKTAHNEVSSLFANAQRERKNSASVGELVSIGRRYQIATLASLQGVELPLIDLRRFLQNSKALMSDLEVIYSEADEKLRNFMESIPNLPLDEVPVGSSEKDNKEIKTWAPEGGIRQLDFIPKPHWELGEQLGILDLERAAKISGARFAVYWGEGARLERALISFMLDIHTREHGYTEVLPPFMVNSKSLFGTGQLPKFASDLFRCADADEAAKRESEERDKEFGDKDPDRENRAIFNDHWLIPTAEVPVT